MRIDFSQGTTQRGIIRILVAIAVLAAVFYKDEELALAVLGVGKMIEGGLGVVDRE